MAKIPDISPSFADLGNTPVPTPDQRVTAPAELGAPEEAIARVGAQGVEVANQAIDMQGKTDLAFAKSNYLTSMIEFQKQDENNPDWQGAKQRWLDTSQKAYDTAAQGIQNPRWQAEFEAQAKDDTWRQYSSFLQNVDVRRKNDGYAKTTQSNMNDMSAALGASDEKTVATLMNNVNDKLNNAVAQGYMTPQQAVVDRQEWTRKYGEQKVQQFVEAGNPEGARDWFNKNIAMMNPSQQDISAINAAVTVPRATGTVDRITAGAPIADSKRLGDVQQQMESGNNPSAVSAKGAIGVMQLLPSTAMEVASKMGVPFDPVALAKDPIYNRMLGDEYRNEMIARYHGNQTLALAAYNAGPGNVDKWIQQFGNPNTGAISDADFINKIPFDETRNYVTAINAKAPPIAGVPLDAQNPQASHDAWLTTAAQLPPSVRDLAATGIQTRINAGQQQAIDTQTSAAKTLAQPVLSGQITDPAQLLAPEMQQAWANARPELQKAVMAGMKNQNKESEEFGTKFWQLYNQVHAPEGDATKITDPTTFYQYGAGNGLTLKGIQQLTQELDSKKTADGAARSAMEAQTFKVVKTQVSGEDQYPGMKDPKGEEIFAQAMPLVYKAIADGHAKGIPDSELYNPKSPNWAGSVVQGLIRPPAQWHADISTANMTDEDAPAAPEEKGWLTKLIEPPSRHVEDDLKAGVYSTNPTAKAQGLVQLKRAVLNRSMSQQKFNELALAYGYARKP